MPYSSKRQEGFYQPHRLVVVERDYGRRSIYSVLRIDTVKRYPEEGFVVATWIPVRRKGSTGGYWEEGERQHGFSSKKAAQDVAKEQAVVLSLPYNIRDDCKTWKELLDVQEVKCIICDRGIGYHTAPDVCDDCKLDAERGRLVESARGIYSIESKSLCSGHAGYDFNLPLARAFYKVVEDVPSDGSFSTGSRGDLRRRHGKSQGSIAKGSGHLGYSGTYVSMTAAQAEALQEIVDIVAQIDETAYRTGYREGSNILTQLATGELPPDAFERKRIERKD